MAGPAFDDIFRESLEKEELRIALRNAHAQLRRIQNKQELLAAATFDGAKEALLALGTPKLIPTPKLRAGRGTPEVALLHMTDWQGSKLTISYSTEVMEARVKEVLRRAIKLVEIQRSDHPVKDVVMLLTGDMVEGLFQFPGQAHEIDRTLFDQYAIVSQLIAEAALFLSAHFEQVFVVAEWGNHGRIGSKRDGVPLGDNFDRMCYHLAAEKTSHNSRIHWQYGAEDIQRLVIGSYRALAIHGDEIGRNGHASPMTIVRFADRWRSGAYRVNMVPWEFRDVYLGHYHTHAEWPMANGEGHVYQTGSIESDNRYAMDNMAATAMPSQRLHFIDPKEGFVTANYQVYAERFK